MVEQQPFNPLVSVLMTCYNREKYIGQAIESVLASSYTHFELIVVDDRSTDSSVNMVNSYAKRDKRVKLFINEHNLGDYPNRNKAASYASGKYLKYVDADDYIYPWGLQILVQTMEQFPAAGWGLCSLDPLAEKPFPFQLSPQEAYLYHYNGPGLFHKAPLSSIIKKEVFTAVSGFNAIRMAGDYEMWHRLARLYPVVLMPHGIVWYRKHGEQEVKDYRRFLKTYENIKIQNLQQPLPLPADVAGKLLRNEKRKLWKRLLQSLLTFKIAAAKDYFSRLSQYYGTAK